MKKALSLVMLLLFIFGMVSCVEETSTDTTTITTNGILTTTTATTTAITTITATEATPLGIEWFGEPGLLPEVFAPGFISTEANTEFAGTFSPDYEQYFYTRRTVGGTNRLYYTAFIDGSWTTPELSPISLNVPESEPFITNDGSMLYFQSRRDNPLEYAIYQSSFIDNMWETPVYVENGLNDDFAMYITVADSGNIYFTGMSGTGTIGIYVIEYVDEVYQPAVFTGVYGAHPYISPDESYMLFDNGVGEATYIYITKNVDDNWSYPVKLDSNVNLESANQICSSVTADGKYFFFSRFIDGMSDIFWVDGDYLNQYLS
ncbi:hypothetical protein RJI07_03810 [Mycoplasmatota bacterium WC30]